MGNVILICVLGFCVHIHTFKKGLLLRTPFSLLNLFLYLYLLLIFLLVPLCFFG